MDWILFGAIVVRNCILAFKAELSGKGETGLNIVSGVYALTRVFTGNTLLDYSEIQAK